MTVLARCKPAGPCTLDSNLIALLLLLETQNFVQLEAAGSMSITCLQPLHSDRKTRTSALAAPERSISTTDAVSLATNEQATSSSLISG
jgi:hypothetical protein